MALRERLVRDNALTGALADDAISNQQGFQDMKSRLHRMLINRMDLTKLGQLEPEQLHEEVARLATSLLAQEDTPLSTVERERLIHEVRHELFGLGPLEQLLADSSISDILVNSPYNIYIERGGKLEKTNIEFKDNEHLMRVIERIVSSVGRRIDESSPLVDARLKDGSRVNAIIPPLALKGPTLTIRKFAKKRLEAEHLIGYGSLSMPMAMFLRVCVEQRKNVVVSGGTGSGKTTFLNVLSNFIPNGERIVTIEDAAELKLNHSHLIALEARPSNVEGRGQVSIRDLVRNALRMRPDRIVVGECRGGEALDMLQAMNTGHDGSLTTIHANAPRDTLSRMETLVLMAGMDLPVRAIREQMSSAIDVIVQLTRLRDGTRRVTHVTEVQGMEGETVTLQDAFLFDYAAGVDAHGTFLGKPVPTGVRPRFTDKFDDLGITLSPRVFGAVEPIGGRGW